MATQGVSTAISIYQSGELVRIAGKYEIVGVSSRSCNTPSTAIRDLEPAEHFPYYEGHAVCWRLLQPKDEQAALEAIRLTKYTN